MKKSHQLFWKFVAVTLAAQAGNLVIGALLFAVFGNVWDSTLELSDIILPLMAGTAMTVAALIFPVRHSNLRGNQLLFAALLAVFGINVFLVMVEAVVYLVLSPTQIVFATLESLLAVIWITSLVVWVFGPKHKVDTTAMSAGPSVRGWVGRLSLASFCYLVLYITAGMLIYPFVQEYYEAQGFTAGLWVFPLQIVRGALYVAFVLWLLRSIRAPRWQTSLAIAFLFPVLAGVAALIVPSQLMPDVVRHWHTLEVGWSNFVYGLLIGYLFWRSPAT